MAINYKLIRDEYIYCESSESLPSLTDLSAKHGVNVRSLFDRSSKENWVAQRKQYLKDLAMGKKQNRDPALLVSDNYSLLNILDQEIKRRLRKPANLSVIDLDRVSKIAERQIKCIAILKKLSPEHEDSNLSKMSDKELETMLQDLDTQLYGPKC